MARIIGILGPSFCGSTILDRMLSMCPGITALGETHWIMDNPDGKPPCVMHYPCSIWTPERVQKVRAWKPHNGRWYDWLAAAVGATCLVTSDKNSTQWKRLGWPDAAIFPFKSANAMRQSYARYEHLSQYKTTMLMVVAEWRLLLANCRARRIPYVEIGTHEFGDYAVMERKLSVVGIRMTENALRPWDSKACLFGGNGRVHEGFGRAFALPEERPTCIEAVVRELAR